MDKTNMCEQCENAIEIGEGDVICLTDKGTFKIIESFIPTDYYYWCEGNYKDKC